MICAKMYVYQIKLAIFLLTLQKDLYQTSHMKRVIMLGAHKTTKMIQARNSPSNGDVDSTERIMHADI